MIGDVSLSLSEHVQAMNVASTIKILTMDYTVFIRPANKHPGERERERERSKHDRTIGIPTILFDFSVKRWDKFSGVRLCLARDDSNILPKIVYFLHVHV